VGKKRGTYRVLLNNLNERDNMEDQDIDGKVLLKCILKIYFGRSWTGLIGLRKGTISGLF
jgi:hypothetical protein